MLDSVPRTLVALTRFCYSYLIVKTYSCPNSTIMDTSTDMCIGCSLYCQTCANSSYCSVCLVGSGYYLNLTSGQC